MIAKSQQAFYRDLPELRKYRDGWWIAYRGDERLGFARKQIDLYEECFRRGLTDDQFVVRHALPLLGQRGLWCAELQSWIDHRRCRVTIRTRRKFWPFC